MNRNDLGRGPNALPELELDAGRAQPSESKVHGIRQPAPPPPRAQGRPQELLQVNNAIELDMEANVTVPARYRPAVRGVTCGPAPTRSADDDDAAMAARIAGYGDVPTAPWRLGLYAYSVLRRKRELVAQLGELRASADQSHAAYERGVLALGERVRGAAQGSAKGELSVGDLRSAAAPAGHKLASGTGSGSGSQALPGASGAERAIIELTFRVLDDTKKFGRDWDPARREIEALQGTAEDRARLARRHELAIDSYDPDAVKKGLVSYAVGGFLVLFVVFALPIKRAIWPAPLKDLSPEDAASVADPAPAPSKATSK